MGLQDKTESSIQTAYLKCIEQSERFVYIENQFFITASDCDGTKIENQIGDAIVNRIIRANKEGTNWRAVILIPLMPGFQNTIDAPDGSSLRLIMYAQYYSLCRGETSIFGRLRNAGIDPEDYISIYGLRGWGKMGPNSQLVTEQVYIHAKIMIVDDRVAIIGSANINERSMRGNRDSEVAAVIRDTEQYVITMGGEPFMVGKFAHTLRMRLQLEHLGVNTDDFEQRTMMMDGLVRGKTETQRPKGSRPYSYNHDDSWKDGENYHVMDNTSLDDDENAKHKSWYNKVQNLKRHSHESSEENENENEKAPRPNAGRPAVTTSANPLAGAIPPNMQGHTSEVDLAEELEQGKRDPDVLRNSTASGATSDETLSEEHVDAPRLTGPKPLVHHGDGGSSLPTPPKISRVTDGPIPVVDPYNLVDPLADSYFHDQWNAVAQHNTAVYRRVFRPMPDNDVKTWSEYKEFFAFGERLAQAEGGEKGKMRTQKEQTGASGPAGAVHGTKLGSKVLQGNGGSKSSRDGIQEYADAGEDVKRDEKERIKHELKGTKEEVADEKQEIGSEVKHAEHEVRDDVHLLEHHLSRDQTKQRQRAKSNATKAGQLNILPRDVMEELLSEVQGHLVIWPTDWLEKEDANGNFLYNIDKYDFLWELLISGCSRWKFMISVGSAGQGHWTLILACIGKLIVVLRSMLVILVPCIN
jgi:phospholipase D1/2